MRVTQVAIRPTEASEKAGRPSLTPELLAASGARYSRNNEGLDAILSNIDPHNLDKSVDSIFRMVDYGHQSIADMAPVAMFIDNISIWLAYYVWTLCPMAGGQESSTRYIKLSSEGLVDPNELGIESKDIPAWESRMSECFDAYQTALTFWELIASNDSSLIRIPASVLTDPSEKAQRQVARMRRNYSFDRSRYFLPVAATTNMMLVMSSRNWAQLCQSLLSHLLPEPQRLGEAIKIELSLAAPRLIRHAESKESFQKGLRFEFDELVRQANLEIPSALDPNTDSPVMAPTSHIELGTPNRISLQSLADALAFHDNRYAYIGEALRRSIVRFEWDAVSMAEIRDLNRHRTGTKYCPLIPRGFYHSIDQLPNSMKSANHDIELTRLGAVGRKLSKEAYDRLRRGDPTYIYYTVLGTQYRFEHVTTADKFIYEAELRTGAGAHFRYAKHLRDALELLYAKIPNLKGRILEGSAEPE